MSDREDSTRNDSARHSIVLNACSCEVPLKLRSARTRQVLLWATFRVHRRVAEEVEEEGLGEGVELGEGGTALGPQRLRPVQHLRDPPLLRQRRQGDLRSRDGLPE